MLQADRIMSACTRKSCIFERIANFGSFDRLNTHHCLSKPGFETFVPLHEAAEANREIERDDFKYPAEGILAMNRFLDFVSHLLRRGLNRAAHIRFFCACKAPFIRHIAKVRLNFTDGGYVSANKDSKLMKKMLTHCPDCNSHRSLSCRRPFQCGT